FYKAVSQEKRCRYGFQDVEFSPLGPLSERFPQEYRGTVLAPSQPQKRFAGFVQVVDQHLVSSVWQEEP
ncbi:MAG: hypothetical protein MK135_14065, partial [Polyangiaceae bacterium]|nr:hypothetical protein [Polyangiaceae bacterium]